GRPDRLRAPARAVLEDRAQRRTRKGSQGQIQRVPETARTSFMNAPLRGDYSRAGKDYSVEQDWTGYSAAEHALFRRLFDRQANLVPRYACSEWIEAIGKLDAGNSIPKFEAITTQLKRKTGWSIVAVPGLIPDDAFFTHLANRRFPVTVWLRKPE